MRRRLAAACALLALSGAWSWAAAPEQAGPEVEADPTMARIIRDIRALKLELPKRVLRLEPLKVELRAKVAQAKKARDGSEAVLSDAQRSPSRAKSLPIAQEAAVKAGAAHRRALRELSFVESALERINRVASKLPEGLRILSGLRPKAPSRMSADFVKDAWLVDASGRRTPIAPGAAIPPGARVFVGPAGEALLRTEDGGVFQFGPNTIFNFEKDVPKTRVDVLKGAIHHVHEGLSGSSLTCFHPKTRTAVSARGTEFDFEVDDERTVVRPFEGRLDIEREAPEAGALELPSAELANGSLGVVLSASGEAAFGGKALAPGVVLEEGEELEVAEGAAEIATVSGYRVSLSAGAKIAIKTTGAEKRPVVAILAGDARVSCAGCDPEKAALFTGPNAAITAHRAAFDISVAPSGLASLSTRAGKIEVIASHKRLDSALIEPWWLGLTNE